MPALYECSCGAKHPVSVWPRLGMARIDTEDGYQRTCPDCGRAVEMAGVETSVSVTKSTGIVGPNCYRELKAQEADKG